MSTFANIAVDEEGAVAGIVWHLAQPYPTPRMLTALDVEVSSVSKLLSDFLPALSELLHTSSDTLGALRIPPPALFVPPTLAMMLAMARMDYTSVPEVITTLTPEARDLKAAAFVAAGAVQLSQTAAAKAESHPYNALLRRRVSDIRTAVGEAFAVGVLLAFTDESGNHLLVAGF